MLSFSFASLAPASSLAFGGNPKMPLPLPNTAQNPPRRTMPTGQTTVLNGDSPHSDTLRVRAMHASEMAPDKWHTQLTQTRSTS